MQYNDLTENVMFVRRTVHDFIIGLLWLWVCVSAHIVPGHCLCMQRSLLSHPPPHFFCIGFLFLSFHISSPLFPFCLLMSCHFSFCVLICFFLLSHHFILSHLVFSLRIWSHLVLTIASCSYFVSSLLFFCLISYVLSPCLIFLIYCFSNFVSLLCFSLLPLYWTNHS